MDLLAIRHRLLRRLDAPTYFPWARGLIVLALAGGGLAFINPSTADFRAFAGERLVEEISKELCGNGGLPVMMRIAIHNCAELVQAQRDALAAVVVSNTRRRNFGVLSTFSSELGGQTLLGWRVPRFRSTVVGVAGQFVLISAATERFDSP